ncbi:MAG: site-specific integrase [Lachnospiraceae bacterium]|jgi:integrase|nr:site-specific integrase [Lachnospiraceae bacterium]
MKLPNGFGTVYKLSGNRRNPYVAKRTKGWEIDPATGKAKQLYDVVGYYPTRKEALTSLAEFNANPYDVNAAKVTFYDVYDRWSSEHFPTVSNSNVQGYKAVWALCDKISNMKFADIKLDHLQMIVDTSGKNYPTLRKLKVLFGLMYKYAVIHEIIPKERNMVEYVNINNAGNPNAFNRKPFSKAEVKRLWEVKDANIYYTVVLMLIYSGCRISELLDLKKCDINLPERYFKVVEAKTASGIRTAPIAEKIYPFFEYWYNLNDCEYLLSTSESKHFIYRNYYDSYWKPLIDTLGMTHRPHDTRHTCISMLTVAGVSDKVIKKIVGHKGNGVTEIVYTHFEIEELVDAINRI